MEGYRVAAQVIRTLEGKYRMTTSLATFVLEKNVLGLVDEKHAEEVAEKLIRTLAGDEVEIHLTVVDLKDCL